MACFGEIPIVAPQIFVGFSLLLISTHSVNLVYLAKNFGGPGSGGSPNVTPPITVAQKSSLISSIAQTLNAVRLAIYK